MRKATLKHQDRSSSDITIPREVYLLLTEKKHLHSAVDAHIRKGMTQFEAFYAVQDQVAYYLPGVKLHYKSAAAYWVERRREIRKMLHRNRRK